MLVTPAVARILPFAIYIGFLTVELAVPETGIGFDVRWLYAAKAACVAIALALLWKRYSELAAPREVSAIDWTLTAVVGVLIFVLWILLDQSWAMQGAPSGWNPSGADGQLAWTLVVVRMAGAAIVVPVMEELFWRSLVMRWIRNHDFLTVVPRQVGAWALLISSALFALEHHQWLAGLLAGFAYASIYMRTGNLWTAVVAHAITNLLLGLWVLYTGQWQFW
jgi:CAAX prenyl protease-like protein